MDISALLRLDVTNEGFNGHGAMFRYWFHLIY